jgi:AcrR family transcriptional regulator
MPGTPPITARGRPRDPRLEDRVYDTAIRLYSQAGWAGFTFGAVARESGVGKAALYRRWTDRGELLLDTLKARWIVLENVDTGSLREDLVHLAEALFRHMTSELGDIYAQLRLDIARHEEVRAATVPYSDGLIQTSRDIVKRAKARGELPTSYNAALVIDLVTGGITNHVIATPPRLGNAMHEQMHAYVQELVDIVMAGIAATASDGSAGLSAVPSQGPVLRRVNRG